MPLLLLAACSAPGVRGEDGVGGQGGVGEQGSVGGQGGVGVGGQVGMGGQGGAGACGPVLSVSAVDLAEGLAPAETGTRQTFDPERWTGSDYVKVQNAIWAAEDVGGAVVLGRVYETASTLTISAPILLTGGGLRRACTPDTITTAPVAAGSSCLPVDDGTEWAPGNIALLTAGRAWADTLFPVTVSSVTGSEVCTANIFGSDVPSGTRLVRTSELLKVTPTYLDGLVVDSVLLDGNHRCNGYTHDWRRNTAAAMRGDNVIRDSVIYDSPSESLTVCGATVKRVRAFDLQGSLVHKSCNSEPEPLDVIAHSYVDGANLATDAVMQHSEGLITFSVNAGNITAVGNVFRNGSEGVFGFAGGDDTGVSAGGDCYESFPHVIELHPDTDASQFHFDVELHDVPKFFK